MRLILKLAIGAATAAALASGFLALLWSTPTSYVQVRRDRVPIHPMVTTSLGHRCQAPCGFDLFTRQPFTLTLSAPDYVDLVLQMQVPSAGDVYSRTGAKPDPSSVDMQRPPGWRPTPTQQY